MTTRYDTPCGIYVPVPQYLFWAHFHLLWNDWTSWRWQLCRQRLSQVSITSEWCHHGSWFDRHTTLVARSRNYHAQTLCHLRHLLTTEPTYTLACSLKLSRLDYCNKYEQRSEVAASTNSDAWLVIQSPRCQSAEPLLKQRIHYRLASLTLKVEATSNPN